MSKEIKLCCVSCGLITILKPGPNPPNKLINIKEGYHPKTCIACGKAVIVYKIATLSTVINNIKSSIEFAEVLCNDQDNGLTNGQVCIAALKDIRRLLKHRSITCSD